MLGCARIVALAAYGSDNKPTGWSGCSCTIKTCDLLML